MVAVCAANLEPVKLEEKLKSKKVFTDLKSLELRRREDRPLLSQ